jgi:hypothetical protein
MSEPTPAPAAPAAEVTEPPAPEAEQPKSYDEDYVRKLRDEAASWRTKYREVEGKAKASMTEAERAVAEAEERGRSAVRSEYGSRLAQTEFRAAAAARNPGYDVAKALAYVDLSKFVGEDGEPDGKAIAAAVADLVPEASNGTVPPPSFDGGTRQSTAAGVSMSQLIRQAAGRA